MNIIYKDYLISSGNGITDVSLKFRIDDPSRTDRPEVWYIGSWLNKHHRAVVRIYSTKKYTTNQIDHVLEEVHFPVDPNVTPTKKGLKYICANFAKIKFLIEKDSYEPNTDIDRDPDTFFDTGVKINWKGGKVKDSDVPPIGITYKFKGSVNSYADLPNPKTDPTLKAGYYYNIDTDDKDHNIIAGDNVVWTGAQWEIFPGKDGVEVKDTNINDIFQ